MRVEYDPKNDLLNIEFLPGVKIKETSEIDGVIFDYDKSHRIVSIEILDASKRTTKNPLQMFDFAVTKAVA